MKSSRSSYLLGIPNVSAWLCYCLVLLIASPVCSQESETPKRPNIVLIMVDDMGFSDLGCYGSEINTPNINLLAQQGTRFNRFYNTSKCNTSRACLLTGMYAQKSGMSTVPDSIQNAVTIAEVVKAAGYRTLMVGKHHGLENMYDRGFDRYYGLRDGMCNYFNPGDRRLGELQPARKAFDWAYPRKWCIDSTLYAPYTPSEPDFCTTDYFTNYAIDYLEEYKDEDKPYFLYLAYNAPHDPLMAWPEDIQKYIGKYAAGYAAIRKQRYQKQLNLQIIDESYPLSEPTYEDWDALSVNEQLVRDSIMAVYAAMIDRLDQNIGRLLDKIDALGERDNTLIMFVSDNGAQSLEERERWFLAENKLSDYSQPIGSMARFTSLNLSWANVCNTPFRLYKDYSHNGGIATPFIVSWPGKLKKTNTINAHPGHLIDIMPTILEVTGARYPETFRGQDILPYDGESLLPALLGDGINGRQKPLYFQWGADEALIEGDWKIVRYDAGPWELYHQKDDKTETRNLFKTRPTVADTLVRKHQRWMNAMKVHISNPE